MLALTLLVRDEEDILEANLDFHFSRGVDFAIVTDHRSSDATPVILERLKRTGRVHVLREAARAYQQGLFVTRMARLAHDLGASWVINGDADEFWWPQQGDLATTLAAVPDSVDVVVVRRTDFPPVAEDGSPFWERMIYREFSSLNLIGRPIQPKVCHRARADIKVAQGNHSVSADGLGGTIDDDRIEVLHFPLRTYQQFETKIRNGGAAYNEPGSPSGVGRAWRHAYDLWLKGRLPRLYEQRLLDRHKVLERLRAGSIVPDTRLRDAIRALRL